MEVTLSSVVKLCFSIVHWAQIEASALVCLVQCAPAPKVR